MLNSTSKSSTFKALYPNVVAKQHWLTGLWGYSFIDGTRNSSYKYLSEENALRAGQSYWDELQDF